MLVLIDIDGTLLLGSPRAHQEALAAATRDVVGLPVVAADILAVGPSGRVDREILRLVLERHGTASERIAASMKEIVRRADAEHARLAEDGEDQVVAPGARDALERLRASGLALSPLTGNVAGIAHRKLRRAALDHLLDLGGGAYGSDAEAREELVPIARRRAGIEESDQAVVVGDTPRDVDCARAGGARCVALTTSGRTPSELRGADHVASDLTEAAEVILGWHEDDAMRAPR